MVNNHTLPTVLYTCAQQYQPDRSSNVQPILFQKPPNDGRWGRESVQPCTACVLWLFPWVKYWPYLGVGIVPASLPNLVLFPVKFDILLHCATLRLESFFQHVIASFLFHPAKEPLTNSSFSFIRLLGAPQADSVSVP